MNTNKDVSAIAFYAESKQAIKFNPHFFQRYKERFIEVCDWQTRNQLATAKDIIDVIGIAEFCPEFQEGLSDTHSAARHLTWFLQTLD